MASPTFVPVLTFAECTKPATCLAKSLDIASNDFSRHVADFVHCRKIEWNINSSLLHIYIQSNIYIVIYSCLFTKLIEGPFLILETIQLMVFAKGSQFVIRILESLIKAQILSLLSKSHLSNVDQMSPRL